ncbi:MAG TPA: nucleoside recognition domain-containing protein [Bacillota bacterium]|nr:nucleoside recognition domain-containing protein [Bacillota bacterium]
MSNNHSEADKIDAGNFLQNILWTGLREGIQASWSIIKIMVPISFGVALIKYFGIVNELSRVLSPLCCFLGLRGEAILALISGYLINCYSAIAVMATLALSAKEVTILATMLLLCHTLPIEMGVQKKAGGAFGVILLTRLFSSLMAGFVLNLIIPGNTGFTNIQPVGNTAVPSESFIQAIFSCLKENTVIFKIIVINISIAVFYRLLKRYRILEKLSNGFKPVMLILGLPKDMVFLWSVTNVLGLIYGASLLIEAKKNNNLAEVDLKRLNLSLATCHALVQETANFLAIGASLPFLLIPRIVIAISSVWLYNLRLYLKGVNLRLRANAGNPGITPE